MGRTPCLTYDSLTIFFAYFSRLTKRVLYMLLAAKPSTFETLEMWRLVLLFCWRKAELLGNKILSFPASGCSSKTDERLARLHPSRMTSTNVAGGRNSQRDP